MAQLLADGVCLNLVGKPSEQTPDLPIKAICARASVSIVLISNKAMQKLNKRWRDKNAPTDVLSFPLLLEVPPEGMPWELGEIFISVEQAALQAQSLHHGLAREMAFLTVHGILHLLGFDHERRTDEKEMFARQEAILVSAGYGRQR
jgi:probable rRNA maturation factor